MYSLLFSQRAEKQFLKLPKDVQVRMKIALERARIRPEQHFERLVGESAYKLRVGKYRIIADISQGKLTILVIEIGHRENIYKRRP